MRRFVRFDPFSGGFVAQQGSPPPRSGRAPTAGRRGDSRATREDPWDVPDDTGEEYPPWAGPGAGPRRAGPQTRQRGKHALDEAGWPGDAETWPGTGQDDAGERPAPWDPGVPRPGSRSRMAAARSRRRSRILWVWGGAAVAVVAIVAVLLFTLGGSPAKKVSSDGLVTTFLPGEFRTVPSVCTSVTSATLGRYLPGKLHVVTPHSLDGSAQSLCNWTLDAPPVYRVLEVTAQAYAPSGLASGDGSATFAATDAYQQALQAKRHPARDTHLPAATVTTLPGLGTAAFAALQVVVARPYATDLETVVARDRNVIVTVVFQGPHSHTGRYGPVAPALLQAGAAAAARDVLSQLH
jgi:hypothetical protein